MRAAVKRFGGWAVSALVGAAVLLTAQPPNRLAAQDSQFGIHGLGTPGKWESVRARSTGGAFAPFDAFSPLLDASLGDVRRLSASVTTGTSWRSLDVDTSNVALRGSRFPALVIAGPLTQRIVVAGGFATYLDRTYTITTKSTITDLRGAPMQVSDEIRSDGAVTDLRLAAAGHVNRWLTLGLGFHLLTGSTRMVAIRRFADTVNYRTSTARDEVAYEGMGGSASALVTLTPDLRVAGWLRSDTKLRADVRGRTTAENDLPLSFGTAIQWRAGALAAVAGTVAWRNWSTAGPDSHDTFNWSLGTELGSPASPFRFGARGGQMPFGVGKAPTEFGLSGGLGRQFSGGRGRLDLGLERLERKGNGVKERVWTLLLGLTVRP